MAKKQRSESSKRPSMLTDGEGQQLQVNFRSVIKDRIAYLAALGDIVPAIGRATTLVERASAKHVSRFGLCSKFCCCSCKTEAKNIQISNFTKQGFGSSPNCPSDVDIPLIGTTNDFIIGKIKKKIEEEAKQTFCDRKCPDGCSCVSTSFDFTVAYSEENRIAFLKSTGILPTSWDEAASNDPSRSCQLNFDVKCDIATTVTLGLCVKFL